MATRLGAEPSSPGAGAARARRSMPSPFDIFRLSDALGGARRARSIPSPIDISDFPTPSAAAAAVLRTAPRRARAHVPDRRHAQARFIAENKD